SQFVSDIQVCHKDLSVNGKSILDLAMLAAECGAVLLIRATGPDSDQALSALSKLVESDFQAGDAKSA
ncbi:MAG: phosphocarrier protein HPr, partial [Planctomycetota bacterium]